MSCRWRPAAETKTAVSLAEPAGLPLLCSSWVPLAAQVPQGTRDREPVLEDTRITPHACLCWFRLSFEHWQHLACTPLRSNRRARACTKEVMMPPVPTLHPTQRPRWSLPQPLPCSRSSVCRAEQGNAGRGQAEHCLGFVHSLSSSMAWPCMGGTEEPGAELALRDCVPMSRRR